jgi:hypothetical protein
MRDVYKLTNVVIIVRMVSHVAFFAIRLLFACVILVIKRQKAANIILWAQFIGQKVWAEAAI